MGKNEKKYTEETKPNRFILPVLIIDAILLMLCTYIYFRKTNVGDTAEDMTAFLIVILIISLILIIYENYVFIKDRKRRKELEEDNRIFNEENQKAFAEISQIRDIIASANMGTWRIEIVEDQEPRMFVDDKMKELLGIAGQERTPEKTYTDWYNNINPDALESVHKSVARMKAGEFDENTYLWIHPTKGLRYVRCGGTSEKIPGGFLLRGYHYDVDDVVREEQAELVMLQNALDEKNGYYATLEAISDIYYSMHVIDLLDDSVVAFNAKNEVKEIVNQKQGATDMMVKVMYATISDGYRQVGLDFTNLSTLAERMQDKMIISKQLLGKNLGWIQVNFILLDKDESGKPTKVICTTRIIDEEKKQEEKLLKKSQTDELTGLFNRRAYEDDIDEQNDFPCKAGFTYISLDVNGLKIVNDTIGHTAGDELIAGASSCMKKSLGSYGKIYRTGGDEFAALIYCDAQKLDEIINDFEETIESWSGKLIDRLSISYGWICKEERPELTIRQLGVIAEERMYEAKSAHYKKMGVDRRGQKDAHKALCDLYTKILKINITSDTYQIINMDTSEQTAEKGFADKISEWLTCFGTSGQVHPDDLSEYLKATSLSYMKDYFSNGKTSLHIFYRRKQEDSFKQVMMEIIPANDYSDENQNLFLYVKSIDK